jgi:hypothetical protein
MKYNKDLLSGQESDSMYGSKKQNKDILKNELEKCKESLQKLDEKSFIDLLQEILLKVKEAYSNVHYSGELSRLRKNSKVASPEYYDSYFSLTLTETLSNRETKNIITKTSNEDDFSNAVLELIKDNRITVFLQRFQDFTKEDIPKENFQIIFNVFMNLGDVIPEDKRGMFALGNSIEVMRIFYQLCTQLDNEVDIYDMYKEAIENSTYSIYTACQEVSIIMQQHGEYEEKEEKPEKLISSEQLQELKKILLKKINDWVKDSLLFEHNKALSIMYLWKRLDEKKCLSYITNNINNEEGLLKFIKIFFSYSSSHSINDYVARKTRKFDYKAIKDFIDVEKIISDIRKLSDSELNEIEKFCVKTFIDFYENKIKDDIF